MRARIAVLVLPALLAAGLPAGAGAVRLKDVAHLQGVRENQLVGYGLVAGLDGTGDKQNTTFTLRSLASLLATQGVNITAADIKVKNVAAVMVTATLGPYLRNGSRLDVTVSSLGDASSLQGGVLVQTPLRGADGAVYAVAQGAVSIGGFSAGSSAGNAVQKNHPLVGRIPNGALVEREVPMGLDGRGGVQVVLENPDFLTATRVARVVNDKLGATLAVARDAGTVTVSYPDSTWQGRTAEFAAALEQLEVQPDQPARVVINERTGTVVAGGGVTLLPVVLAHGGLTIEVRESTPVISQPAPLSGDSARTVVARVDELSAKEAPGHALALPGAATPESLARMLNTIGVTPRDLIAIFQALKQAGSLQAELVIL
ncbi:MAG TPA: flagellar basal body P-ring protein FlgI [Candidatus Saccharimonadales bacterium]|nr:flagellar basal body P-ring protein FlgI [Candidatus Saccharimonadales bacterium]